MSGFCIVLTSQVLDSINCQRKNQLDRNEAMYPEEDTCDVIYIKSLIFHHAWKHNQIARVRQMDALIRKY